MNDAVSSPSDPGRRRPASTKGKLRGPKPPLRVDHVWSIRARLQLERRVRYRRTGNLRAVQLLLGHTKIESTVRYLGVEIDDALDIAEKVEI